MHSNASSDRFPPVLIRLIRADGVQSSNVSDSQELSRLLLRMRPTDLEILDLAEPARDHGVVLAADALWRDRMTTLLAGLGACVSNCYLTPRMEQFTLRFELVWVD